MNGEENNIITGETQKMRKRKFHVYLDESEYRRVVNSLIVLKNSLIQQGRYTDAVDDVLCKALRAKRIKIKIKHI